MAMDYLGVPCEPDSFQISFHLAHLWYIATSTAVECVFSAGRHLLPFTQNRLSGKSVCQFLCLGDWSRKDLIKTGDIVQAIQAKIKKAKCSHEEGEDVVGGSEKRQKVAAEIS